MTEPAPGPRREETFAGGALLLFSGLFLALGGLGVVWKVVLERAPGDQGPGPGDVAAGGSTAVIVAVVGFVALVIGGIVVLRRR